MALKNLFTAGGSGGTSGGSASLTIAAPVTHDLETTPGEYTEDPIYYASLSLTPAAEPPPSGSSGGRRFAFGSGKCCCTGKCNCCANLPTDITFTPYIYKPFTGPHCSKDGGTYWYNPENALTGTWFGYQGHLANAARIFDTQAMYSVGTTDLKDYLASYPGGGSIDYTKYMRAGWLASVASAFPYLSSSPIVCTHSASCQTSQLGTNNLYGGGSHYYTAFPSCINTDYPGLMCYHSSVIEETASGGTALDWKSYTGYTGTKLYTTRAGLKYSTYIRANAWLGNIAGETACRLHIVCKTETTWTPDWTPDTTFPYNQPFPPSGIPPYLPYTTSIAHWKSAEISEADCCDTVQPIACNLVWASDNRSQVLQSGYLSQWYYDGAEGKHYGYDGSFTPLMNFHFNPACVVPSPIMYATIAFLCPEEPPPP